MVIINIAITYMRKLNLKEIFLRLYSWYLLLKPDSNSMGLQSPFSLVANTNKHWIDVLPITQWKPA